MAKTPAEQVETAPQAVTEATGKAAKRPLNISPSLVSFLVVVGALGYLIYASLQAFKTPVASATPQVIATPKIPELKLNQENKRKAPEITVDESDIGKTNPFTQ